MLVQTEHSNTPRWVDGERLHHLFEQRCDMSPTDIAAVAQDSQVTYSELDERANRLARYLFQRGIKAGDRVALIFDKSVEAYVAMLAVMKAHAAYVPLDAGFPNDRIAFILEDAGVRHLLSMSVFATKLGELSVETIFLDSEAKRIGEMPANRLSAGEIGDGTKELSYIIYTSGTTGKPKGVAVNQASICNFVRVAAEIYGYGPGDRVYQGMTIAFDFSVEELWVPLMAGATLVPARAGASLVGDDLADFLLEQRITGMCCVPTLLATIEKELPELRLLLLSGEACPQHLVTRWSRPGRRILNVYGPTEATVTATLAEVTPDRPVTIGGPLPTYTIVILDADTDALVAEGASGEIGIAGIGLAEGYLNRPDLTAAKFIPDFLGIPNNPSKRIYRTGDLGRINSDREVEYQGRIDTQVKVRGYRIELTEIESLLMEFPQVAQAVVNTFEPEPGAVELVAYYSLNKGADDLAPQEIRQSLGSRLPPYMVPAYFEKLDVIPMTTSNKADRKNLPAPSGRRLGGGDENFVAPRNDNEAKLAEALAKALKVERVSVTANFFKDLGAHSLLMARFCSDVRQNVGFSDISMRDVYSSPTIQDLAAKLESTSTIVTIQAPPVEAHIPTALEYYGCGALQALFYVGYGLLGLWILKVGFEWTYAAIDDFGTLYVRLLVFAVASFVGFSALPIAAKWLLIGRWKETSFPVWSLSYFRFWMVKALIRSAPAAALAGSPIYAIYLRLLGARIGRNVAIRSTQIPVTTDLFSVGDNTFLSKESMLVGYKAVGNRIHIGAIEIGANSFVGEASVLDIDTVMEDGTQLGHASSLQRGQRVPAGKHFHGSPAVETTADYCRIERRNCTALRRWLYTLLQIVPALMVAPVVIAIIFELAPYLWQQLVGAPLTSAPFVPSAPLAGMLAVASLLLLIVGLATGLAGVIYLPRLFNRFLQKDRTYVLYGVHYFLFGLVAGTSNVRLYNLLFGDSSAIVHYLRWIGWELNEVEQTGSNFGTNQRHDNPFLCEIGSGTMVSDGLSMMNAAMSATSFRLSHTKIGDHNYLGNNIHYPHDGRTGENVLLGTKVMIPIDGPVRENVGLLGSPAFEIPRAVSRDLELSTAMDDATRALRLHTKNRHNLVTIVTWLLSNWLFVFVTTIAGYAAIVAFPAYETLSLAAFTVVIALAGILFFAFTERASLGFKPLKPRTVPVLAPYFWAHERHWKFCESPLQSMFKGTPFKNVVSRLLGVKVGRRVFDDGAQFLEKTLITVGDYANLNEGVTIQGHSLEEGVFKSDYISIGSGCSLGTSAFIHYGVRVGENVVIDPDSFLMKGEIPEPGSIWQGNPAKAVGRRATEAASDRQVAQGKAPPVAATEKAAA